MSKRIFLSPPWMGGDERALVDEAFESGYIAPCGPMVNRFEREFAEAVGALHACALASGTAALDLLFHELGVGCGDRVFCSDLTFVSSIASAVQRGAEPVFIDCDEATWTMDPDLLEEALAQAAAESRLPKAVVAVDLYGQCCDYDRIGAACQRYGVPLIIDAAEALGASYCDHPVVAMGRVKTGAGQWRSAGDAGWAVVYSFNGNKIITTSGGGMLVSNDAGVVERARKRAQQAREAVAWYEHCELGYNYRMSNIVAAIGVGQLAYLERIIRKKRQIFEWYQERLDGAGIAFMPEAAYGQCTRWLTVGELLRPPSGRSGESKNGRPPSGRSGGSKNGYGTDGRPGAGVMRIIEALEQENIEARPVWKPMHLQPVFQGAQVFGGSVGERLFANGICLPSGAGLEEADVARVCKVVLGAVTKP